MEHLFTAGTQICIPWCISHFKALLRSAIRVYVCGHSSLGSNSEIFIQTLVIEERTEHQQTFFLLGAAAGCKKDLPAWKQDMMYDVNPMFL